MRKTFALTILAAAALSFVPQRAIAQADSAQANGPLGDAQSLGGSGGRHGHRNKQQDAAPTSAPLIALPKLVPDPRQRLDPGALLCGTEAELRQHQTAIMARAAGREAAEPQGCRFVRDIVAVSVLDRDGPARTHVRLAGDDQAGGWTDAVVRDAADPR